MKPDKSNVILVLTRTEKHEFIEAYEAGSKIDSTVLNRVLQYAMHNNLNMLYQVGGGWNAIGMPEFLSDHGTIYHVLPENDSESSVDAASEPDILTP